MKGKCSMPVFLSWVFEGLFTCYQLPFSLVLERMLNLEIVELDRQMIWKIYETLQIHSDDMTQELKIRIFLLIIAIFFLSSFEHWFSFLYAKNVVFSEGNNFTLYHTMCATEKRLTSSFKVVFFFERKLSKN